MSPWTPGPDGPPDEYDPQLHGADYSRGPGCWPIIVMVLLAWSILGWLAYCAWLLFGQ